MIAWPSWETIPFHFVWISLTLVYGVRLIPEGTLKGVEEATLKLADGSTAGLTLHTFDGTIPQLRRSLDRSLDAFFDLLPGAEDEDVEKFGE